MSEIKTTKIIGETGVDAVNFTSGLNVTGVSTATNVSTASSVTASYSVTADQYLCSVTETSGSTTLTDSAPTLAVAVVVANNSRSCP